MNNASANKQTTSAPAEAKTVASHSYNKCSARYSAYTSGLLNAALSYAARGWYVFPCRPRGKEPLTPHGFKDATTDEQAIREWWTRWPDANIGIPTGAGTFVVLDVDVRAGGDETLHELVARHGPLPDTPTVITGGGGTHYYFKPPATPLRCSRLADGLEIKADGGYVVAPPSVHPSGRAYAWELSSHYEDVPLAEMPQWLLALVDDRNNSHHRADTIGDVIPEGQRNSTLTSLAGTLRRRGLTVEEMLPALLAVNARCQPPLSEDEVRAIAVSVGRYEPAPPHEDETLQKDYGHAERLSHHFLGRFRWSTHLGKWMEWTGSVWRAVPEERVAKLASDILRTEYVEQLATASKQDIARLAGLLRDACTYARITGALAFLKGWDGILTMPSEWDADPWLLNCLNGVIDLRTMELKPHSPDYLITKLAPVRYDPLATSERWQAHLDRFLPNRNVQRQVQRDLGVALVGATLEEALSIWYGTGANGKTTTARVLQVVLGDYAKRAAPNLLVASKHERHPTEIADLCGARVVFSIEVDECKRLAEALMKELTGGDKKKARYMRQDFFEFDQTFSITLIANHKPVVTSVDEGTWRRIRLIPWEYRIPEAERRPQEEVVQELVEDGAAILNWLLAGLQDWQADRHWIAPEVRAATEAYQIEQDVLAGFLSDCCELGPRFTVAVGALYEAYTAWCANAGEEAVSKTRFSDLLRQRGIGQKRVHGGSRWWVGIRLRSASSGPEDLHTGR